MNSLRVFFVVLVCFMIELTPSLLFAELKENKKKAIGERLIEKNKELSKKVDSFVEGIDLFLSGEKNTKKVNKSTLVLSNRVDWQEGGETVVRSHFDVDLRLPNLEKKWKLKLSSYDEAEAGRSIQKKRVESTAAQENYGTSLEFLESWRNFKILFRPRLQLSPKVGLSYLIRFSKAVKLTNSTFKPTLSFYAKPETGTGVFSSLNTEYGLKSGSSFVIINEGEYGNFENKLSINNGFAFSHLLSGKHMSMVHSLIFESTNRENYHLSKIVMSSGFYHKPYYRVFHYALTPYFSFDKEHNFKGNLGFRVDANLIF